MLRSGDRQYHHGDSPSDHSPPSPSSHAGTELCRICRRIDFKRAFYHEVSPKNMGIWIDIAQSRDCPFCRLMVQSLQNCPDGSVHDDDEIVLENAPSWELGIEKSPYDTTKTDSYSNKFDLRSKAKDFDYTAYRIIIKVKRQLHLYGLLQRLSTGESKSKRHFFGREMASRRVDISLLRNWIQRCERLHGTACAFDGHAGNGAPESLRLIDVSRRRIITLANSTRLTYLTLSYVWGVEAMQRETGRLPTTLTRDMIRLDDDGFEDTPLPNDLPYTVEDAVQLTNKLGFRYIWIDALCIVQDDPIELKDEILHQMDAIYNCSLLTIVAASGHHANVGIPGLAVGRELAPWVEVIKGIRCSTMSPSFSELENSRTLPWNTRGWTFQEKILAKRLLMFTDHQVYFRCAESVWIEEAYMETDQPSKSMEARPEKYRWGPDRPQSAKFIPTDKTMLMRMVFPQLSIDDPWGYLGKFPDYAASLREYTCRELSNPGDKLKAIYGVFHTLESDTGHFIYGHPENYFLQSLLWHPEAGSRLMRADTKLPSWSWAGWHTEKGIGFDVLDVRVLRGIMLALRAVWKRLSKAASAMGGSGSGSGSSSGADYSSSSGSGSSGSSGSSGPSALSQWYAGRQWSTLDIAGKASGNVAWIFAVPLLDRRHTVDEMHLCENGKISPLSCDESLKLNTFLGDEQSSWGETAKNKKQHMTNDRRRELKRLSLDSSGPFLSLRAVVIRLHIGRCLGRILPTYDDEASIFELVDTNGDCAGEVWTTLGVARQRRSKGLKFLTISWGLALNHADIARSYRPRWLLDAARLPESRRFMEMRPLLEKLLAAPPRKTLAGRYGASVAHAGPNSEYTVMSFLDALFTAKQNQPLPKFLWSTVNVLLVDEGIEYTQRLGVGKVILGAWLMCAKLNGPEEVLLR